MPANPSSNDEAILDLTDIVEEGDAVDIQGKVNEVVIDDDSLEKELDGLFGEMGQVEVAREAPTQIEPHIDLSDIFDDEPGAPSPQKNVHQPLPPASSRLSEPDDAVLDLSEEESLDVATAEALQDQDEDADGEGILDLGLEHSIAPEDDGEENEPVFARQAEPLVQAAAPARGDDLSELDALIANLDEDLSGSKAADAPPAQDSLDNEDESLQPSAANVLDEADPIVIPGEPAEDDMEASLADILGKEEALAESPAIDDEDGSEIEIAEDDAEVIAALAQAEETAQGVHSESNETVDPLEEKIMAVLESRLGQMQAVWEEKLSSLQKQWQERLVQSDTAQKKAAENFEVVPASLAKLKAEHQALGKRVDDLSKQFGQGVSRQEVEELLDGQSEHMLQTLRSEIPAAAADVVRGEIKALVQDLSKE